MKDSIVKKIFTSDLVGKRLSAAIIASVLKMDEKEVLDNLEYLHPEISDNIEVVNSIVDVMLENDKILINIEFNTTKNDETKMKNETYIVQLYLKQIRRFYQYKEIKPVIQINIDDYDYFKAGQFVYTSIIMEKNLHLIENEKIQIYHINLKYLDELLYNKEEIRLNELASRLYFIVCDNTELLQDLYKGDELMSEVVKEANRISDGIDWSMLYYNPEELQKRAIASQAKKVAEGMAQDMAKDMAQDMAKDMVEKTTNERVAREAQRIAKQLLSTNLDDDTILKITGISKETLNKLKDMD